MELRCISGIVYTRHNQTEASQIELYKLDTSRLEECKAENEIVLTISNSVSPKCDTMAIQGMPAVLIKR